MKIADSISSPTLTAFAHMNLSRSYILEKKLDSALLSAQQAEQYFRKSSIENDRYYHGVVLLSFGKIYLDKGDLVLARSYLYKATRMLKDQNNLVSLSLAYKYLSDLYLVTGPADSALYYAKKCIGISHDTHTNLYITDANSNIAAAFEIKNRFDSAYYYLRLSWTMNDSLKKVRIENVNRFQNIVLNEKIRMKEMEKDNIRLQSRTRTYGFLGGIGIMALLIYIFYRSNRLRRKANKVLEEKNTIIMQEKKRSDELLLNILPAEVADEIKQNGRSKAKTYSMVTVMFTDFKDFAAVSEMMSAELLVGEIDHCYSAFDNIIQKHRVEKIKTVGDAYICVGGMPELNFTHPADVIHAAMEIRDFILTRKKEKEERGEIPFEIRIGIHTGPVVAGIVGIRKFAYDIWGDTVNVAARMEQNGEEGKINISGATYKLVRNKFNCVFRGKIEAKNKGEVEMYFVETP